MIVQGPPILSPAQQSSDEICKQILSFCANIYHLLGENLKSDFYKWMLCCDLKNKGFSYQMCGTNPRHNLYTDTIKIGTAQGECIYLIVRTESNLQGIAQLHKIYPSHYLQPAHSLVVNFGNKVFEYKMI